MKCIISEDEYWKAQRENYSRAKELVTPILRTRNGVDFLHISDILASLAARHPEVVPTVALLNDEDASEYLREQLRLLEVDDPGIFALAPSREEFARLTAYALQGAAWRDLCRDTKAYYWTNSDLARDDGRRRQAHRFRQIISARNASKAQETEPA